MFDDVVRSTTVLGIDVVVVGRVVVCVAVAIVVCVVAPGVVDLIVGL